MGRRATVGRAHLIWSAGARIMGIIMGSIWREIKKETGRRYRASWSGLLCCEIDAHLLNSRDLLRMYTPRPKVGKSRTKRNRRQL